MGANAITCMYIYKVVHFYKDLCRKYDGRVVEARTSIFDISKNHCRSMEKHNCLYVKILFVLLC